MKRVYLAGGMHTDWQERVKEAVPLYHYLNPMENDCKSIDEFTTWDLSAVKECDIIFVYVEKTNPTGQGMAFEAGYAKALGKKIIFVFDKDCDESQYHAFGMVRSSADVVFIDFDKAVEFLKKLALTFL